ncbi:Mu transposase domain-containing protein [Corynebacterium stercoris]|uniref:Mu transposase domain-containing protein n=1 Tax=Corynebacterium stercoris TaxID=2943490 RepID=UPI003F5A065B
MKPSPQTGPGCGPCRHTHRPSAPAPRCGCPATTFVTVDTNHYSVDPAYVDRLVTVHTTLHHVTVTGPGGETIATHQRIWAKGRTITDPAHQAAAKAMRQQRATTPAPKPSFDIAAADLTVYDRITSSPAKRTTA